MRLVRVSLPYATFGVVCRGGVVVEAAPIARWMVGRTEQDCARWVRRKQGTAAVVSEEPD